MSDRLPTHFNPGYICGAHYSIQDIPTKYRATRVRWVIHPERSESGTCQECREFAGQFMSMEEAMGLQPLHDHCKCGVELEPAPGVSDPMGELGVPPWSLQRRRPELWEKGVEFKHGDRECIHG